MNCGFIIENPGLQEVVQVNFTEHKDSVVAGGDGYL